MTNKDKSNVNAAPTLTRAGLLRWTTFVQQEWEDELSISPH
jgi:hypothetical protein